MRIAIFTNNYLPNPYGVPGSVESFRKEFEAAGHAVFIFAPRWPGYADENMNVFRYPSLNINYKIKFPLPIPYSGKINKILEKMEIDIIHSQHPNLLGSAAMKWAKKKNIPLVFTWHTLYGQYANFVPVIPKKLAAWWAMRNARRYANKCDFIITPTPTIQDIIKGQGVNNGNIESIPTGVEEGLFTQADGTRIRERYGAKKSDTVLIFISRLTAEKNVEFLFEAVAEVLRHDGAHPVKFLVGGEGYLRRKLEKIVSENKTESQVIFAGLLGDDIKKDFYAAGDIFVFASKSETQGMILTEAMYSGLPIVAVRAPGAQDIVEDGKTGFLVSENKEEFAAAVQKLIGDKNLRLKFSEEAKKVAREKYTSAICAKRMLEVYEKAIKLKKMSS